MLGSNSEELPLARCVSFITRTYSKNLENRPMKALSMAVLLCLSALMPWPDKLNYLFEREQ
jgi:hypothetical protein